MHSELSLFDSAARMIRERQAFVFAIVVQAQGSTAASAGAVALFNSDGEVVAGWIGGGCAASVVGFAAQEAAQEKQPRLVEVDLDDDVFGAGLGCGGKMSVFVAPRTPAPALWIFGAGRVAESLCLYAAEAGFSVNVAHDKATAETFARATAVFSRRDVLEKVMPGDYALVASQSFQDADLLAGLADKKCRYVGIMASRKRSDSLRRALAEKGCDPAFVQQIRAPAGLELHARTPEEIALEIAGELVERRRSDASCDRLPVSRGKDERVSDRQKSDR